MRHLILAALLALVPAVIFASQEPPPVALSHTVTGTVRAGRPFVVNLKVESLEGALKGEVRVTAAVGLTATGLTPSASLRTQTGRTLAVPVTPTQPGVHELTLDWMADAAHPAVATVRLFVDVPASGAGRVLTLPEMLNSQAIPERGAGARAFPLLARPLLADAPAAGITGQLVYTAYAGGEAPARRVTAELYREKNGKRELVTSVQTGADGRFTFALPADAASAKLVPVFTLSTPRWKIADRSKVYQWEAPALQNLTTGADLGALSMPAGQVAAEAMWIHVELNRAQDIFEASGADLTWWTQIPVQWPGSGDYFSWGTVNLTKPFQWDVTLHEFGHAIFHYGSSAQGGGGQHKIDECYSKGLAWSEGWASFFAAQCHEARDAADAKFEFMVPRRAPIRVENVPDDVCQGDTNEWRVASALWDVYDTHADGADTSAMDFPTMWQCMREGSHIGDVRGFIAVLRTKLDAAGAAALKSTLEQNTIR